MSEFSDPLQLSVDPKNFVSQIRERNDKFYNTSLGLGSLKGLQQTFSNPWLYVAELLQNAVDANATRIRISVVDSDCIIVEHNGDLFREKDVDSLCVRGVSTKGAGTVGFMGVGFKSVFKSFECVDVSSGPWRFGLQVKATRGEEFNDSQRDWLGAVLPEWDDSIIAPSEGMTCRFRLWGRLDDLADTREDLGHIFGEDRSLLALLAWQGVRELNWDGTTYSLESEVCNIENNVSDYRATLTSFGNGSTQRWILFSRTYQPSKQAVAKFLEHRQLNPISAKEKVKVYGEAKREREVVFFCELNEDGDPICVDRGSAFAFLPTGVTLPIGVNVQADWLLHVSRRGMMQIEGNQWHIEILEQIPTLLKHFVDWLVAPSRRLDEHWQEGYGVFPGLSQDDHEIDSWFENEVFVEQLKTILGDLKFLPVPSTDPDGEMSFVSPTQAQELPKAISTAFEDRQDDYRYLFGDRAFSKTLLGLRASRFLKNLKLFNEYSPNDLVTVWSDGAVGRWLNQYEEADQFSALNELLSALSIMDQRDDWKDAELCCLPSESGEWISRKQARRHPGDWGSLAKEQEILTALERHLGNKQRLLKWEFERQVARSKTDAKEYVDEISRPTLDSIVRRWFILMSNDLTQDDVDLVVRFTSWVREKQPLQRNLIRRILCVGTDGRIHLEDPRKCLLAEPFAGAFRGKIFPDHPKVSTVYLNDGTDSGANAWRTFFESLANCPIGKFELQLCSEFKNKNEIQQTLSETFSFRETRVGYQRSTWKNQEVKNGVYTVVDAKLPESITSLIRSGEIDLEGFKQIADWMEESPAMFRSWSKQMCVHIAYNTDEVYALPLPKMSDWFVDLTENAWIFPKNGTSPYRPSDLLAKEDPARLDAPVANLPVDLMEAFQAAGIEFGHSLPDAPAIVRLRVQGPSVSIEKRVEFLNEAISEAGDDSRKLKFLQETLNDYDLFPINQESIDRKLNVPLNRVVVATRSRSLLNGWLTAADSFAAETNERKFFELANSLFSIPATTTFDQAVAFLSWVWETKPDANRVRGVLPRAYQYAKDDLSINSHNLTAWQRGSEKAAVYVLSKKGWHSVREQNVYYDDIANNALKPVLSDVQLATPGHLGETVHDQLAIAEFIGLGRLSTRFRVQTQPSGQNVAPEHWNQGFTYIQRLLQNQILTSSVGSGENDEDETLSIKSPLRISRWNSIETVVFDHSVVCNTQITKAAIQNGTVIVSGSPREFAGDVAVLLCDYFGIRRRHSLPEMLGRTILDIADLDDQDIVMRWMIENGTHLDNEKTLVKPVPESPWPLPAQPEESTPDIALSSASADTKTSAPQTPLQPPSQEIIEGDFPADVQEPVATGGQSRSHTSKDHDAMIQYYRHQLEQLTSLEVSPDTAAGKQSRSREKPSDERYREAVVLYEKSQGRIPVQKPDGQDGHDIDSFARIPGKLGRRLVRRIEVKGRGRIWQDDEIVKLSRPQFHDAINLKTNDDEQVSDNFDYWLYVVEQLEDGRLNVLPLKNPSLASSKFELRAATWKHLVEDPGINEID